MNDEEYEHEMSSAVSDFFQVTFKDGLLEIETGQERGVTPLLLEVPDKFLLVLLSDSHELFKERHLCNIGVSFFVVWSSLEVRDL